MLISVTRHRPVHSLLRTVSFQHQSTPPSTTATNFGSAASHQLHRPLHSISDLTASMDDHIQALVEALRSHYTDNSRLFHVTINSPLSLELEIALVDSPCFQGLPWELQCSIWNSAHELQSARATLMESTSPALEFRRSPFIVDSLQRFSRPSMLTG